MANTKNVNFTSSEIAEKIWAAFLQIVISLSHFFTKKARGKNVGYLKVSYFVETLKVVCKF